MDLSDAAATTTDAVGRACAEWGAFHVANHGVPPGLLDAMRAAGLAFFRAPMEEKLRFGCDPARGAAAEGYGSRILANEDSVLDWRDYFDHHTLPSPAATPTSSPDTGEFVFPSLVPSCLWIQFLRAIKMFTLCIFCIVSHHRVKLLLSRIWTAVTFYERI